MAEGYIGLPVETDPDAIALAMIQDLMALIPGYDPKDGHLSVWIYLAVARVASAMNALASSAAETIFEYYGKNMLQLSPIAAVRASVFTTWTMNNDAGYTVDAGTFVGIRISGDVLVPFTVLNTFTVPPGSTVQTLVEIAAVTAGEEANDLPAGPVEPIDNLEFVSTIVSVADTSGGVDPESSDDYRDRLVAELKLLSPRPILAEDFAVMARRVAGVYRSVGLSGYAPARTITNATRTNLSTALGSLTPQFTTEDVGRTVTGTAIPALTTIAAFVSTTQVTMSAAATGTASPATVVIGDESNIERVVTVALVDEDGAAVTQPVKDAVVALLDSEREVNFIVYTMDPTYTPVAVTYQIEVDPDYDSASVKSTVDEEIDYFISPAQWGGGDLDPPTWDFNDTVVRLGEVFHTIYAVEGVVDVPLLQLNGVAADVNLAGVAPLPSVGAIVGTVV